MLSFVTKWPLQACSPQYLNAFSMEEKQEVHGSWKAGEVGRHWSESFLATQQPMEVGIGSPASI